MSSNGYVGIGTSTPNSLLSISNSVNTAVNTPFLTIASTTGGTSTTTLLTILANGTIGVGTTSPSSQLGLSGNFYVGGTGTSTIQYNLDVLGTLHGKTLYAGDLVFANNFRFTEAPLDGQPQGIILKNQNGVDTMTVDENGNITVAGDVCANGKQCFGKSLNEMTQSLNSVASSTAASILSAQATTTQSLSELSLSLNNQNQIVVNMNGRVDALEAAQNNLAETIASTTKATVNEMFATSSDQTSSGDSLLVRIAKAVMEIIKNAAEWVFNKITATLAVFNRVETQTAAVSHGLEITDQATGQIYCVVIKNGDWDKQPGACGTATSTPSMASSTPAVVPAQQAPVMTTNTQTTVTIPPVSQTIVATTTQPTAPSVTVSQATTTDSVATTTETVISGTVSNTTASSTPASTTVAAPASNSTSTPALTPEVIPPTTPAVEASIQTVPQTPAADATVVAPAAETVTAPAN